MSYLTDRRGFLQSTALTGVGVFVSGKAAAEESKSPNERIRFACIGVGGKGGSDSADAGSHGDVVAICDVDDNTLGQGRRKSFPKRQASSTTSARCSTRWARASTRSPSARPTTCTPPPPPMAMRMGKHCFCAEAADAHDLRSPRAGRDRPREEGRHADGQPGHGRSRRCAKRRPRSRAGRHRQRSRKSTSGRTGRSGRRAAIRPGRERRARERALGPVARPGAGAAVCHRAIIRSPGAAGGTSAPGRLGDMACHTVNMPFMALDLRDPISVAGRDRRATTRTAIRSGRSSSSSSRPTASDRGLIKMIWYDGGKKPAAGAVRRRARSSETGVLVIGEKGKLYLPRRLRRARLQVARRAATSRRSSSSNRPATSTEWVQAIKGGEPAMSNFPDYAGPLTETILLGNLAVWAANEAGKGKKIEWDAKNLKATNAPEVEVIIKPTYRAGYTL